MTTRYLYSEALDELFASQDALGDVLWTLEDHQNTVRQNVETDGTVVNEITYDSFGNILSETNPGAGDRFKFTGREWQAELDLYYYRARWYDPAIGRFMSEDPSGFDGGDANLYRYVNNSPVIYTDPSGLQLETPQPQQPGESSLSIVIRQTVASGRDPYRVENLPSIVVQPGKACAACHPVQNTPLQLNLARDSADNRAVADAAANAFFASLWNSVKNTANGTASRAAGDRWVGIVENRSGHEFRGDASDWWRFSTSGGLGDFTGVNPAVEAGYGYDLATESRLSGSDRVLRGIQAGGAFAGNAAGGLGLASRAPGAFPTATRLSNTTIGRTGAAATSELTFQRQIVQQQQAKATGHATLAERRILSPGDVLVEASKPSMRGQLGKRHIYNNPGHHDPAGGLLPYNQSKTVLPGNHVELFDNAIPYRNPHTGKITYYAKDANRNFHRFQSDGGGSEFHWNGQTNGFTKSGTKVTDIPVPAEVKKLLEGQ